MDSSCINLNYPVKAFTINSLTVYEAIVVRKYLKSFGMDNFKGLFGFDFSFFECNSFRFTILMSTAK